MANVLTVYYSRRGENYFSGGVRSIDKGNTEVLAEAIHNAVGGDLFEIDTVKPYASDYTTCTKEAQEELRLNARPELKTCPASLDAYDTIFLGYPNWWGTCPMAVFSFLERYDLTGKRIIPFCTNEGSGLGRSESDLARVCKGATMGKGLAVLGSKAAVSAKLAADWARNNL